MRRWKNGMEDDGSRHAIGNGNMLVYGIGPNVEYVYGPPYSSPPLIGMTVRMEGGAFGAESERVPGTAIWKHRLGFGEVSEGWTHAAAMMDYMLPDRQLFVREIESERELRIRLEPQPGIRAAHVQALDGGEPSWLFSWTKGPTFLAYDPVTEDAELLVTARGEVSLERDGDGLPGFRVRPGSSRLVFAAGTRYPELILDTAHLLAEPHARSLDRTRQFWETFTSRRTDFSSLLPSHHPQHAKMLDAIDSVSVLLKCQQSASGGMVPGHRYSPMAYVRDMAGVLRGYLALGYPEEALAILRFWKAKWERFGNLQNAEGMGDDSVRLSGGNNEVEIPAYVILCVLDYVSRTGDDSVLGEMRPMLQWAFEVQLPHLAGGMTEFSNDETYIAGGVFPRHLMFQGSAESTLMFVTGGVRLAEWAERLHWWTAAERAEYREILAMAADRFKPNFMPDGVLYANQPERERLAGKPRFQFGFCDAHGALDGRLVNRWLELQEQGYYLCAECKGRAMPDPDVDPARRYELNSVSLLPMYYGCDGGPLTPEEAVWAVKPGMDRFRESGAIPSDLGGSRALGYDCGLMLYNAVALNDPVKEPLLRKVLGLVDPTGAWAEYYDDDRPAGCRARPWESAMNIEGVAAYIRSLNPDGR